MRFIETEELRPSEVKIKLKTNLTLSIHTDDYEYVEAMREHFTRMVPGFQYMPQYRSGFWNGRVGMIDKFTRSFPYGILLDYVRIHKKEYPRNPLVIDEKVKDLFRSNKKIKFKENLKFKLRPYQKDCIMASLSTTKGIIRSATACHIKGDKIILYNGVVKNIEDIKIGDYVIGKDGCAKKVINTFTGVDDLYNINPKNNRNSITVTKNHLLHLTFTNRGGKYNKKWNTFENISVEDYLQKSKTYKHQSKLYYNKKEISFIPKTIDCNLSPYFIGLYLGDGGSHNCSVYNADEKCINAVYEEANKFGMTVSNRNKYGYFITGKNGRNNIIFEEFKKLGLLFGCIDKRIKCENRFIPRIIFNQNIDYRKEVLAGLIDSDGCLTNETYYEFISKSKKLAEDVKLLSVSLGLVCSQSYKIINDIKYHRIVIMGNISKIPVRIERKKCKRKSKTDAYKSGFDVEYIGKNEFYGIQVEDSLYLMEDGLVTHNSGKSLIIAYVIWTLLNNRISKKSIIIVPSTSLIKQFHDDMIEYGIPNEWIGEVWAKKKEWDNKIVISTWQSLSRNKPKMKLFDCVIVDECLDGDTRIETVNGKKKISDIQIDDRVISYNVEKNVFEEDIVENIYENMYISNNEDMYEIEMENGSIIKITGNHKVLTKRGYIRVDCLSENDEIISIKKKKY